MIEMQSESSTETMATTDATTPAVQDSGDFWAVSTTPARPAQAEPTPGSEQLSSDATDGTTVEALDTPLEQSGDDDDSKLPFHQHPRWEATKAAERQAIADRDAAQEAVRQMESRIAAMERTHQEREQAATAETQQQEADRYWAGRRDALIADKAARFPLLTEEEVAELADSDLEKEQLKAYQEHLQQAEVQRTQEQSYQQALSELATVAQELPVLSFEYDSPEGKVTPADLVVAAYDGMRNMPEMQGQTIDMKVIARQVAGMIQARDKQVGEQAVAVYVAAQAKTPPPKTPPVITSQGGNGRTPRPGAASRSSSTPDFFG